MSIAHRPAEDELQDVSIAELYAVLGERDTPVLYGQPYTVNTEHDIPFGAGNSIDRKTIYVDKRLYAEVMDGEFRATGLDPEQIISCWLDHEHAEISICDGDNAVDLYFGGHRCALRKEHERVLAILGQANAGLKITHYEGIIWPGLVRCYARAAKNPPKDLWCAPLLDDPDERDEEHLKGLARLGVADAAKRSKYSTHYGISGRPCRSCRHWAPQKLVQERGQLAICEIVSGLVREDRHCDFFVNRPFHPRDLGARQAKDGNWYLPDHKRPGKYLWVKH